MIFLISFIINQWQKFNHLSKVSRFTSERSEEISIVYLRALKHKTTENNRKRNFYKIFMKGKYYLFLQFSTSKKNQKPAKVHCNFIEKFDDVTLKNEVEVMH